MHPDHDAVGDERFKFWPTSVNQAAFREVLETVEEASPLVDDPDNTVHEAWTFFRAKCEAYAHAEGVDSAQVAQRYAALRESVAGLLQIVTISLDKDDPAQLIFETLNARGTPLLAMDLVKNALFDRAAGAGFSVAELHDKHRRPQLGDAAYWSQDQRLGRVVVPRSEAFLFHWLVMQTGHTVSAEGLFDTFRRDILGSPLADDSVGLVKMLNDDAASLRRFDDLPQTKVAGQRFFATLDALDTTTMSGSAESGRGMFISRAREPGKFGWMLSAPQPFAVSRGNKHHAPGGARKVAALREKERAPTGTALGPVDSSR